jgi:drug/metabolite transporter (DMT)-like permease
MAGLLNATTPLMTVLVISFGFREQKVNRNQIVGVVIGFVGIILVTGALGKGEKNDSIGVLALLLATFCYGIAFPYSKKYVGSMKYSSGSLAATQVSCSALMLLPFVLFSNPIKSEINIKTLVAMILLGSFGTGFAYIWNFRNVRLAGSTMASTVTYLTPIVASILGIAILGEPASMIQLFGGLLVLVSAALVQQRFKIFSDRKVDANEDFSI